MSTEYRRGIPSVAHIEAATRLGLEWEDQDQDRWRFEYRNEKVWSDVAARPTFSDWSPELHSASLPELDYRPIRSDGTPVDWDVLDQEVARVGQHGQPLVGRDADGSQFAINTDGSRSPLPAQPQGFRADLWQALSSYLTPGNGCGLLDTVRLDWRGFRVQNPFFTAEIGWPVGFNHADILARWTVYQELKPLYDLVDGAQGEAAMPRDVEAEWCPGTSATGDWILKRNVELTIERPRVSWHPIWRTGESPLGTPLRNFAAVLDAVAEQRVRPRRFPARANATARHSWARIDSIWNPRTIIPTDEQGNPVSWESIGQGQQTTQTVTGRDVEEDRPRLAERRIPAFMPSPSMAAAVEASRLNEQRLAENPELWREAQRQAASSPRTADAIYQELRRTPPINVAAFRELQEFTSRAITQVVLGQPHAVETDGDTTYVNLRNSDGLSLHDSLKQQPLPRFTADELDDVDHSATTTQDSATLKRGKLPTVEAIGKYREVMAKRNGTVAEAVKASGIDCEVAQYVLERWAGGLSDREAEIICDKAYGAVSFTRADIAKRLSHWFAIIRPTLDTSEPADTAAQRQRAEAAERKARMAALQAQLAKERAARIAEPEPELSRFALLEVDEAADPSKSIEAWKAQRAANERRARNTVHHVTVPTPQPAPKRKPFEVVDVEADGLSGGTAFAVLLSRAMNQNC